MLACSHAIQRHLGLTQGSSGGHDDLLHVVKTWLTDLTVADRQHHLLPIIQDMQFMYDSAPTLCTVEHIGAVMHDYGLNQSDLWLTSSTTSCPTCMACNSCLTAASRFELQLLSVSVLAWSNITYDAGMKPLHPSSIAQLIVASSSLGMLWNSSVR